MLYNHEVWRGVRKKMETGPPWRPPKFVLGARFELPPVAKTRPQPLDGLAEDEEEEDERIGSMASRKSRGSRSLGSLGLDKGSRLGSVSPTGSRSQLGSRGSMRTAMELDLDTEGGQGGRGSRAPSRLGSRKAGRNGKMADSLAFSATGFSVDEVGSEGGSHPSARSHGGSVLGEDTMKFFSKGCASAGNTLELPADVTDRRDSGDSAADGRRSSTSSNGPGVFKFKRDRSKKKEKAPEPEPEPEKPKEPPNKFADFKFDKNSQDPTMLRCIARKHRLLFPEVSKYKICFDKNDGDEDGNIERQEFERVVYGVLATPQKVRLSKKKMKEMWSLADPEEHESIDFEQFLIFYKANVGNLISLLKY